MDCKLRAKNCGGCPMLGMDYAAQLKQKEETVKKLLGKFGPVEHIRGMETPYHYRNKVISTFTTGWGGKLTSGIYAANSHKVLPVESCLCRTKCWIRPCWPCVRQRASAITSLLMRIRAPAFCVTACCGGAL